MPTLGTMLRQGGEISHQQLHHALHTQAMSGGRIGDILLSERAVGNLALYKTLARQMGCSFVNLKDDPPDAGICEARYLHEYIRFFALPWRKLDNGTLLIATSEPTGKALKAWLNKHYGGGWRFVVTSPFDIRFQIERLFAGRLSTESRTLLYANMPERSAKHTLNWRQKISLCAIFFSVVAGIVIYPWNMGVGAVVFFHLLYATAMLLKASIFEIGRKAVQERISEYAYVPDKDLPLYTILVPLYHEAESLPGLLQALGKLQYPTTRLDIKLIIEADDTQTMRAALRLKPAHHFDILRVPPSNPRTKPKACNYALRFARGDFVTIYDAEDRPEPNQLRKAVAAFRLAPKDVVCLQARLRYYNADENRLTRLFELEYRILFRTLLPGLQALGIPLPLGGTSNHFYLKRLRALGAWDPYNVTEDADLGVRIAAAGYRTRMLDSFTLEEAPIGLNAWLKQRSRWIKGYMQTWCVHMRSPWKLMLEIGVIPFMGLQFFIGISCLAFLTAPIIWALSIWLWLHVPNPQEWNVPAWFGWISWANLFFFLALHWQQAFAVLPSKKAKRRRFFFAAMYFPLYWFLHSLASYKALWQLIFRPHYWEKTVHGVSKKLRKISC